MNEIIDEPVLDEKPIEAKPAPVLTIAALVVGLLAGAGGMKGIDVASDTATVQEAIDTLTAQGKIIDLTDSMIKSKMVEAVAVAAHEATIPAIRDTAGRILTAEKKVNVPRVVEWPKICIPARGHFVLDTLDYKPITVIITQGEVIIKKMVDIDPVLLREAKNAMVDLQINVTPLNGTKTRGVDSLKNEEL